eukprot:1617789-Amphidinium_carterae.1
MACACACACACVCVCLPMLLGLTQLPPVSCARPPEKDCQASQVLLFTPQTHPAISQMICTIHFSLSRSMSLFTLSQTTNVHL